MCQGSEKKIMHCDVQHISPEEGRLCQKAGIICQGNIEAVHKISFFIKYWILLYHLDSIGFDDCESGDIRLTGSSVSNGGRIEICINNAWGTICGEGWDVTNANIVCAQLGFQPLGKI